MSFMPWSDDFVTGLPKIDEQHRWLVETTNRLHGEVSKPVADRAAIGGILEGLVEYAMNHFILEEELFSRHGYPGAAAHKEEHDSFSREAASLLTRHEAGGDVTLETMEFLKAWLRHHILVVDKAYVPFLLDKGAG